MTDAEALDFISTLSAEVLGKRVQFHLILRDVEDERFYDFRVLIPGVKNTKNPKESIEIVMRRTLSKNYGLSKGLICDVFRGILHDILKHEADEAFDVGGERPYFPH